MTQNRIEDQSRLQRYIEREQLRALMNDTKWEEAVQALMGIDGFFCQFRVKSVRDPEPAPGHWEGSFPWHLPHPYANIEWLEIDPIVRLHRGHLVAAETVDYTGQIIQALQSIGVSVELEGHAIRILGYLRPTV
jgi:hypothetical protein